MKERPILFSGAMVRAIIAGRKTQTRRVVKPQPTHPHFGGRLPFMLVPDDEGEDLYLHSSCLGAAIRCPYGQPGDRLWVREAWVPDPPCDGTWGYTAWAGSRIGQIAGVPERFRKPEFCNYRATWPHKDTGFIWTPGIHMPRWASRITLEVTAVRVERLQDISEADAQAEGADCLIWSGIKGTAADLIDWPLKEVGNPYRNGYAVLWESINGPGSWEANPWVWVVEFKRLEAAA